AALQYVVLNLVGSAVMLLSIGGIYATVGTLNMADLARRLADPAAYGFDPAPVLGLSALLFAVFALKAGIVPFQFWVPGAYRAAPAPVSAMLAGVVKKVGVYAIIRLYFEVFAAATLPVSLPGIGGRSVLAFYGPVLFVMATASIVFGGVSAVARDDLEDLLAYSSIGQVGFTVLPLAIAATIPSLRGLAIIAVLIYALNHALAKALLFLVSGTIRSGAGSTNLQDVGGLSNASPLLTGAFLIGGLALVGIPPLSGFFAKLLVFKTALGGVNALPLGVALLGAILTIAYISRAWNRGFWGDPSPAVEEFRPDRVELTVLGVMALAIVAVGIGFDPVIQFARAASDAALARGAYIDAVDLHTVEAAMKGVHS
ncbi:MAG: complex I subunit 5 family protein, partial [Halodesulfurarchaeum sp.]